MRGLIDAQLVQALLVGRRVIFAALDESTALGVMAQAALRRTRPVKVRAAVPSATVDYHHRSASTR